MNNYRSIKPSDDFSRLHDSREAGISAVAYRVSFVVDIHLISVGRSSSNTNFCKSRHRLLLSIRNSFMGNVVLLLVNVVATQLKHEIQRIQALLISISEVFNDYL